MSDTTGTQSTTTVRKKRRGPTKLQKIAGKDVVGTLEWIGDTPCGDLRPQWANYCGKLARGKVYIIYPTWKHVPNGIKDTIWLDVQRKFCIPDDYEKKRTVLKECNGAWKNFRMWIRDTFIFNDPPPDVKYPYEDEDGRVTREHFEIYKKMVTTEEYMEKKLKGKESQKFNIYRHRMGSTSNVNNEPKWAEAELFDNLPQSTSAEGSLKRFLRRPMCWVMARTKKNAEGEMIIPDKATQDVVDKMDEWSEKVENGEFQPHMTNDILSRGLGKPEHSGRLRGMGAFSGIKTVFGSVRRYTPAPPNYDDPLFTQAIEKVVARKLEECQTYSASQPYINIPSSCNSAHEDPLVGLTGVFPCELAVPIKGRKVVVAYGLADMGRDKVHNTSISPENVCVSVDRIEQSYVELTLPCLSNDLGTLEKARGSFVQWPRHLVIPKIANQQNTDVQSSHCPNTPKPTEQNIFWGNKCVHLHQVIQNKDKNTIINIPDGQKLVVSEYQAAAYFSFPIETIMDVLAAKMVESVVMEVFIFGLINKHPDFFDEIAIANPTWVCATIWKSNDKVAGQRYLGEFISKNLTKQYILVPYHEGKHWVLMVVNMRDLQISIYDPLPRKPGERPFTVLEFLKNAILAATNAAGVRLANRRAKYDVNYPEGAKQPRNSVLCGYYVMRYMYDIVMHYRDSLDVSQALDLPNHY